MNSLIAYIIAISFQLSGSLMLLIYSISSKRKSVIKRFIGNNLVSEDGNTKEISYDEAALKETFKEAYLNKCAFISIILGYIISIFGDINEVTKIKIIISIIICTFIILFLFHFIVNCILKYSSKVNEKITSTELESLGLSPHLTSYSNEEIEAMFNDILENNKK